LTVLLVAASVGACAQRFGASSEESGSSTAASTTTTRPANLEPADAVGPDPFTPDVAQPLLAGLIVGESVTTAPPSLPPGVLFFPPGNGKVGLYGGTGVNACDAAQLVAFLQAEPAKAAAWAQVQAIAPEAIGDYVATLMPAWLMTDTRVTNHGFSGGVATPRQSTLAAGTAVLVDSNLVPRVRCKCGNPLTPPQNGGAGTTTTTTSTGPPITGQALTTDQMLGYWTGSWGDMVIVTNGVTIGGVYTHDDGTVLGEIGADGVFRGWWTEAPSRAAPNDAGEVEFRLVQTPTGTMLDGRWRYDETGEWNEDFDLTYKGNTDGAPPELMTRATTESLPAHP